MADTTSVKAALGKVQSSVDAMAAANVKAAKGELDARNAALKAAEKAGLSVDGSALSPLGASDAARRYLTLIALLTDCQTQLDQIASLTA